jgi:hypothetical protein
MIMTSLDSARDVRAREKLQYRILLTLTYPLFLLVAFAQLLLPGHFGASAEVAPVRRSVFRRATILANSTIPFAFMG